MNTIPTTNTEKMYGWFSPTAYESSERYVLYLDTKNRNVNVTCVTNNPDNSGTLFKDIVFVGELSRFVSSVPKTSNRIQLF